MANVADNEIRFTTDADFGPGDFLVRSFTGVERLSTPYEFEIELECRIDGAVGLDDTSQLLAATCQLAFGPHASQTVSGFLREIELLDLALDASHAVYQAVLVPRMWQLRLVRRSRVFNEMTVPDILRAVLRDIQLVEDQDFELRLRGDYPVREYVVQYEESDFDFIGRWMERLGIFYFFEQDAARERLVLTDRNEELMPAPVHPTLSYGHHAQVQSPGSLHRLRMRQRTMPSAVRVRDYNWRTPNDFLTGDADVDARFGRGVQSHYGDHFKDRDEAGRVATLRAEEWGARRLVFSGRSASYDLSPGQRVSLVGAPIGDYDQEYVLTAVVHRGAQDHLAAGGGSYDNHVEAIAYATPFRPPRLTRWPRIEGIMHAKVDAEQVTTAAPIDALGRYRVVLPYDQYGRFGGRATRWIRKSEGYTGPDYGFHFPLHVGAEVVIAHVDGDPDRPIIVGAVPNPATGSVVTERFATRNAIRTHGGILFDFEDDAQG